MALRREACLIGGQWVTGNEWLEVDDPATGMIIGRVPSFGADETAAAIDAAAAAMPAWAALAAKDRANVLRRLFDLVMARQEELAQLLTAEQGKPLAEARGEIAYAAAFLEWFGEEAKRAYGEIVPGPAADKRILVLKQPVGVVAAITPWNFPAAMVTRKLAPALAAGCALILKPAEQTPFTALAIGALAQEAGVPAGVLNIVTGDPVAIGGVLTAHPRIRKLSFTGSTATGAKLFAQCAPTIKKLSLELGGNAPFIVFDDADLDAAVAGAILSKFRNAGQTCVCANRFYVQSGVYEPFLNRLVSAVSALRVGPGTDETCTIGPLINEAAIAKVDRHVADALDKGARLLCGGARRHGRFYTPTVIGDVTSSMLVANEETFGPLAAVVRFETDDEVLALANDSPFGLAAYVYGRDLSRLWRIMEGLETGIVGVNTGLISTELGPFGGVKASGVGREGSRHGLDDYLELKYVCLGL
ncbi:NAD-dependent succinate-semialdehyde dehydrogenase [Sphingomonas sp. So64.6b]|uniref:NAD-dependent succinate-semialdehyde dehydrogenase n=1 Tax=Sphingomonas sp. So64.6b TaxID=2997354 RepID=UPI001FCF24B0|nr:NAD-dependent succinate-semialdehyde dehydrogenase [Sphingomonas sp. So64.6b]